MKPWKTAILLASLLGFLFMAGMGPVLGESKMEVTSSAFKDGETIPTKYAMSGAGGKNVSIPIEWKGVPQGVKSFAVSIVDPHPVAKNWVHWLVINIAANVASLPEGASGKNMPAPPTAIELKNSFGGVGYGGPQPPKGSGRHPYVVTVYALDADTIETGGQSNLAAFRKAIGGHVLAEGKITGYYEQ